MVSKFRSLDYAAWIPGALILLTAVIWTIVSAGYPFVGDDLFFHLRAASLPDGLADVPRNMGTKFLSNNGRLGDVTNALWLYFIPRPLLVALCGLFMAALYCVIIRASGAATLLSRTLMVAVVCLALTWWDLFMTFVIQCNYIWGAAMAVFVIMTLFDKNGPRWLKTAAAVVAFPAAAWHEMAGSSLAVGLVAWLLINRRRADMPRIDKVIVALFVAGSVLPYLSPMLWSRLGDSGAQPDDSYLYILLKSDYLPLIMVVAAACLRRRTRRLAVSPWIVWAVAAVVSMLVSPLGGVVGRSGWFGQIYALIALWPLLGINEWRFRFSGAAVAVVAAVVIYHNVEFLRWQLKRNAEMTEILDRFRANPAEPVYIDITGYDDIPAIVVGKSSQPLSNEYFGYRRTPGNLYFDGRYLLTILPSAINNIDFSKLNGLQPFGDGYISDSLPVETDSEGWFEGRGGSEWIAVDFTRGNRRFYYIAPRRFIPGLRPATSPLPVAADFPPADQ